MFGRDLGGWRGTSVGIKGSELGMRVTHGGDFHCDGVGEGWEGSGMIGWDGGGSGGVY
jgi:hypothetical protein